MDDVFYIHNDPNKYLNLVEGYFHLKDPLECHIVYLRSDISKFEIPYDTNGVTCWAMSIDSHVKKSLQVFESKLKEKISGVNHRTKQWTTPSPDNHTVLIFT